MQTLQFALVLTVAAVPVALPAVLSVTLAVGAIALAKKEAIVSRLVAIEEMAGMDILCSDKTGTITQNRISIAEIVPFGKHSKEDVVLSGALASKKENNDPIDNAFFSQLEKWDGTRKKLDSYRVMSFKPFDPVGKHTESSVKKSDGKTITTAKGAPQVILALLPDAARSAAARRLDERVKGFAERGERALGVAEKTGDGEWEFIGLIALSDPPREDSAETIRKAGEMGVSVKMVTGDHVEIAKEIAGQVHLGKNIHSAEDVMQKPDREALKIVEEADGFAQVYPDHKYHIVDMLQKNGHIVGMTGDGVNDAPALRKADVGIAVAGATNAAKSAASIVFTKPGLSVIIDALIHSREIFQRMQNYSIYRITETIGLLAFITASIIIYRFYPVTALMIVLLALLNDAPIMTIAYDNVRYSNGPEKWNMRVLLSIATGLGLLSVIFSFLLLSIGEQLFKLDHATLQSFIYLKLSVAGHLTVIAARTRGPFWSVAPSKQLATAIVITQIIATLLVVYGILLPAMGWALAGFVWLYSIITFLIMDFVKVRLYGIVDHEELRFKR